MDKIPGKIYNMVARKNIIKITLAFLLPVVGLGILTAQKAMNYYGGTEVEFMVTGFDPRDLLSGHYLRFTVVYDSVNKCSAEKRNLCIFENGKQRFVNDNETSQCKLFIKGECSFTFKAGIELFYVNEHQALDLEKKLREKDSSILVSVNKKGTAQIKELRLGEETLKSL